MKLRGSNRHGPHAVGLAALTAAVHVLAGCAPDSSSDAAVQLFLRSVEQPQLADVRLTSGLALAELGTERVLLVGTHSGMPRVVTVGSDLVARPAFAWPESISIRDHHATVIGDFDGDGRDDFYFVVGAHRGTGRGANALLLSTTAHAIDHAAEFGVEDAFGRGRGGVHLDLDNDGRSELIVLNHRTALRAFTLEPGRAAIDRAAERFGFEPADDESVAASLESGGDGRALRDRGHFVHTLVAADFDLDGFVDFVALGGPPVQVLRNSGGELRPDFEALPPAAYLPPPAAVVAGDFDGDGHPDLYLAYGDNDAPREFDRERRNRLLRWQGKRFEELPVEELGLDGKGVALASGDLDLDGRLDLVIAQFTVATGRTDLRVFLNRGDGHFVEDHSLLDLRTDLPGRPDALFLYDFDGDGALDLIALLGAIGHVDRADHGDHRDHGDHGDHGGAIHVFRNEVPVRNWVRIELTAEPGASVLGARVSVRSGRRWQHRQQWPVGVAGSSFPVPLHFGLGAAQHIDEVVVVWPDGRRTQRRDVQVNSHVQIARP